MSETAAPGPQSNSPARLGPEDPGAGRASPAASPLTRRDLVDSVLVVAAVTAGGLSDGWPENPLQWLLLFLAAVLGGIAPHTPLSDFLREEAGRLMRRLRPQRPLRVRRLLLLLLVLALAAGFGRWLVTVGDRAIQWGSARLFGCPPPAELRVLTTAEGLTAARLLVDEYTSDSAGRHQGCPTVNGYVYAAPLAETRTALRGGWLDDSLRSLGPRPDLWLPGATRYVPIDPAATSNGVLREAAVTSLATTPLVLAVPSAAGTLDAPQVGVKTWAEAMAAELGVPGVVKPGPGVVRPDPTESVTGEFATLALYRSGHVDDDPADQPSAETVAHARDIENRLAQALDTGGFPLGDAVELLCLRRQLDTGGPPPDIPADRLERFRRTALVATEQQLIDYNTNRPLGPRCPGQEQPLPPSSIMLASYPTDTVSLDFPLVDLVWRDRTPGQADQVALFRSWLAGAAGKRALNRAGLRPYDWPASDPLNSRYGVQSGVEYDRGAPTARELDGVLQLLRRAQRPGRVLVLLDASGSMREQVATTGPTRFDVAREGVAKLVDRMSVRDEFGLWTFQGQARPRRLAPLGPGATAPAVATLLNGVRPGGGTPLYRAMVDGVAAFGPVDPDRTSALVVLTDGTDEGSGLTAEQLRQAVERKGVRIFVVAIGAVGCAGLGVRKVVQATAGACYEADVANLDARLGALVDRLWEGSTR